MSGAPARARARGGVRERRGDFRVARAARRPPAIDRTMRRRVGCCESPRHTPPSKGTTWKRVSHSARARAMAAATPATSARSGQASGWGGRAIVSVRARYRKRARAGLYDRGGGRTMASILKLPDIWRVIRELDLESIRRDAEGRFRLVIPPRKDADPGAGGSPPSRGPPPPRARGRPPFEAAPGPGG